MELISELPENVEKHYVGKRAGRHSLPQPQINELLADLAKRGLNVVRLKGGDPFVFGRIGEEAKFLTDAGIRVIMVPGVTAASAAAAMGGFSLTSRQESSWIFIATGHPAENSSTPVPWDRVASLPGGTLVIYMGIARLASIVEQLLDSGMPQNTPAVVVQAASTGLQRSVQAPLNGICDACSRQGLKPPALVIIGEPVRCRAGNYTSEKPALAGKRVLITGPARETGEIAACIREAGAQPLPYPAVVNRRYLDDQEWKRFSETLHSGAALLLRSVSDVDYFLDAVLSQNMDMRSLARIRMVSLGERPKDALFLHGIRADDTVQDLEFGTLRKCLSKLSSAESLPLVWVKGSRDKAPEERLFKELRCEMIPLTVREEFTAVWDPHWKDELSENPPDFILFTGDSEVASFVELIGTDDAIDLARRSRVVAAETSIGKSLRHFGITCHKILHGSGLRDFAGEISK